MALRTTLRRWHIWLGWLIGVPMLFWTVSGVLMVIKPIEEVRGSDVLREPAPMTLAAPPIMPDLQGLKVAALKLEQRAAGPRWVITTADGTTRAADPATGALLPPVSAADAAREVASRYTGQARVAAVSRVDRNDPPLDFRRESEAWQVRMSDGAHFYVDAAAGEIVARRTAWWRFYDFMWGLHIMDLQTREDTHNPWIVAFGLLALASTVMALVMLPLTGRRRRKSAQRPAQ